jgi:hypothetical protein
MNHSGSFDFGGRKRHAVTFHEHLIARRGLAINADQIVFGLRLSHLTLEEFLHCRTVGNVHVVREAGSVVVDEQDFHVVDSFG